MIIVLMGVSGCGKTTVGQCLASALDWPFYEGDAFHPAANVDKMARGVPLTDADREPWLQAIRTVIDAELARGRDAIVACSALKQRYRHLLAGTHPEVRFVYLRGSLPLIQQRLAARRGHFMPAALLQSQFDTLEEPTDAYIVDVAQSLTDMVMSIRKHFGL